MFLVDIHSSLKLLPCPYCGVTGALILHGFLRGYREHSDDIFTRAHRVFCSNRRKKGVKGCGRTAPVYSAEVIPRVRISAMTLQALLNSIIEGIKRCAALKDVLAGSLHLRSVQRYWHRFAKLKLPAIRTELLSLCPPPQLHCTSPPLQTIRHLINAFPSSDCTVKAFQLQFQKTFF